MSKIVLLAFSVMIAAPTIADAYCADVRRMPDGTLCPDGEVYDGAFDTCMKMPTN